MLQVGKRLIGSRGKIFDDFVKVVADFIHPFHAPGDAFIVFSVQAAGKIPVAADVAVEAYAQRLQIWRWVYHAVIIAKWVIFKVYMRTTGIAIWAVVSTAYVADDVAGFDFAAGAVLGFKCTIAKKPCVAVFTGN